MTNNNVEIHFRKLKFYRNYCASRSSCIPLIVFSSIFILLLFFNPFFDRIIFFTLFTEFLLYGMFALAICYTIFYAKVVNSIKYFRIWEQLNTIYKISTAILIVMWVSLVFQVSAYCLTTIIWSIFDNSELSNLLLFSCFILLVTVSGCLSISLIVLSSVGLSKYSTYGKKYEIFSEYKQIK